jgi:uncharacterized spore protein YtfJ
LVFIPKHIELYIYIHYGIFLYFDEYIFPPISVRERLISAHPMISQVNQMGAEELLQVMLDRLEKMIEADAILGAPIDMGEKVVLPVAGFGFGFGIGGGGDSVKGGSSIGGGAGAGITPVAVIIAHKDIRGPDGIQVLSLKRQGAMAEIIGTVAESLPTIVQTIKTFCGAPEAEETGKTGEKME